MHKPARIRSGSVIYRQGFIEVDNIHEGCVNLETWHVLPDVDLTQIAWVGDEAFPDGSVTANTELELSPDEARALAAALIGAARKAEGYKK